MEADTADHVRGQVGFSLIGAVAERQTVRQRGQSLREIVGVRLCQVVVDVHGQVLGRGRVGFVDGIGQRPLAAVWQLVVRVFRAVRLQQTRRGDVVIADAQIIAAVTGDGDGAVLGGVFHAQGDIALAVAVFAPIGVHQLQLRLQRVDVPFKVDPVVAYQLIVAFQRELSFFGSRGRVRRSNNFAGVKVIGRQGDLLPVHIYGHLDDLPGILRRAVIGRVGVRDLHAALVHEHGRDPEVNLAGIVCVVIRIFDLDAVVAHGGLAVGSDDIALRVCVGDGRLIHCHTRRQAGHGRLWHGAAVGPASRYGQRSLLRRLGDGHGRDPGFDSYTQLLHLHHAVIVVCAHRGVLGDGIFRARRAGDRCARACLFVILIPLVAERIALCIAAVQRDLAALRSVGLRNVLALFDLWRGQTGQGDRVRVLGVRRFIAGVVAGKIAAHVGAVIAGDRARRGCCAAHADLRALNQRAVNGDGHARGQADVALAAVCGVVLDHGAAGDGHRAVLVRRVPGRKAHAAGARAAVVPDRAAGHLKGVARADPDAAAVGGGMVAADLAAVNVDIDLVKVLPGNGGCRCVVCDLAAVHIKCTAGQGDLSLCAVQRAVVKAERAVILDGHAAARHRALAGAVGQSGCCVFAAIAAHINARGRSGQRDGIAVQADIRPFQQGVACERHVAGQVVVALRWQAVRFRPRQEGHVRIAELVRVCALLAEVHGLAVLAQIQVKARAVAVKSVRKELPVVLPAGLVRHRIAIARAHAILIGQRNAEFRVRVQLAEGKDRGICQQDVLGIPTYLRAAGQRERPAQHRHAGRAAGDLAALHAECAVGRQVNARRTAGDRAALHHERAALECHDRARAGDRAAGGLFVVDHQRQRAALRDRDGIAAGTQRIAVQAEHGLAGDIPCAAQRGVRAQIVVSAAPGRGGQRLELMQPAAGRVRVQRFPCVGIAVFRHAPVGGVERRRAAHVLLIQPPRVGVVRARALAVVEQPCHLTIFERVAVIVLGIGSQRCAVNAGARFVQIPVFVKVKNVISAIAVFDLPAVHTGRDGIVLRLGKCTGKIAAFDRTDLILIGDARRARRGVGGGKFADSAAAVFDQTSVLIGDQAEAAADGERAVDPHGAALDRALVLLCDHAAAGGRGHRADLDRQPLHLAGIAEPPEQILNAVFGFDRVSVAIKRAVVSQVIADARPVVAQRDVRRELCTERELPVFVHAIPERFQLAQAADEYGVLCRPRRPLGAQQRLRTLRRHLVLRCQSRRG